MTTRKRGRDEGSSTSNAAVTPPETLRGQRKNLTYTSPTQTTRESPPRKTRRGISTPDTPQRTSPRGRAGGRSPAAASNKSPKSISPRGRGQRNRGGSTDSNASSVGNSVTSSTPSKRRGQRESNSSGMSAASENLQITPPTSRGRKRKKRDSPPTVNSKKTNGASPQYSPRSSKKGKSSAQAGTSSPAANGRDGRRPQDRRGISETLPQEDLDEGTDEESLHLNDEENSILQNSTDSLNLAESETSAELQNSASHHENDAEKEEKVKSPHVNNDECDESVSENQTIQNDNVQQHLEKQNSCKNVEQHSEKPKEFYKNEAQYSKAEKEPSENNVQQHSDKQSVSLSYSDSECVSCENEVQHSKKQSDSCENKAQQHSEKQRELHKEEIQQHSETQCQSCDNESQENHDKQKELGVEDLQHYSRGEREACKKDIEQSKSVLQNYSKEHSQLVEEEFQKHSENLKEFTKKAVQQSNEKQVKPVKEDTLQSCDRESESCEGKFQQHCGKPEDSCEIEVQEQSKKQTVPCEEMVQHSEKQISVKLESNSQKQTYVYEENKEQSEKQIDVYEENKDKSEKQADECEDCIEKSEKQMDVCEENKKSEKQIAVCEENKEKSEKQTDECEDCIEKSEKQTDESEENKEKSEKQTDESEENKEKSEKQTDESEENKEKSEKQSVVCDAEEISKQDISFSVLNSAANSHMGVVATSQPCSSNKTQLRTCDKDVKGDVPSLTSIASLLTDNSSHRESSKRRQISGDSSDSGSPEAKPSKKARLGDSVPDMLLKSETVCCDSKSHREKCKGKNEKDSQCVNCVKMCENLDLETDTVTRAETFLESLVLTEQQIFEVCSVLPAHVKELSDARIVEALVETLLDGSTTVTTMNAPRFNKFLRQLLTHYCNLETTKESKHVLCEKAVQWARDRKSVNLRHELELTLMSLYYSTSHYKQAEVIANSLYSETKKLQDKEKTVKACLCLSQVYHAMGNISKARANITTAKTEALKIYTPPDMQGELDLQSGIMQVAEGKDMETAYSYFKEAATGFTSRKQRARALKYMLLSKIMVNRAEEGEKAVRSQSHIQDIDEGVEAMLAITAAANKSSLADFRKTREQYSEHLAGDMVVAGVLDDLYTTMMEKNLLNIILPYERLQIRHIADRIGLPRKEVERRLSQMILDKRINAQLDHRDNCLYVYASEDSDAVYQTGIDTLSQLDKTVSHLNRKVKKLL